jgi:hypothetical protein
VPGVCAAVLRVITIRYRRRRGRVGVTAGVRVLGAGKVAALVRDLGMLRVSRLGGRLRIVALVVVMRVVHRVLRRFGI